MPHSPVILSRLAGFVAVGLLLPIGVCAQESPFIPDGFGAAPAPVAPPSSLDRFEFRGVVTIGTETFVTLVDTSTSRAINLAVGETLDGLRVSDFRSDDGSVQLESGGQTKRVKLPEAKIVAMAAPPPPPMAPQNGPLAQNPPQGPPPAVAGAPISDEEARMRMQRVAEEIRRRREMRRQMLENQQQQGQGRPAQ
jgi:hypothetical protein